MQCVLVTSIPSCSQTCHGYVFLLLKSRPKWTPRHSFAPLVGLVLFDSIVFPGVVALSIPDYETVLSSNSPLLLQIFGRHQLLPPCTECSRVVALPSSSVESGVNSLPFFRSFCRDRFLERLCLMEKLEAIVRCMLVTGVPSCVLTCH